MRDPYFLEVIRKSVVLTILAFAIASEALSMIQSVMESGVSYKSVYDPLHTA
jgi:hypothetical protein